MSIGKYISELLFDYECIVIPGLGGFVVNDRSARISYDTHYFNPPFREVMFNPVLSINDGLLINHIADKEHISYKEAMAKVEDFVLSCQDKLAKREKVVFEKVGVISKDENGKIAFKQDESLNFNPDAFGLSAFVSPAVYRETDEDRVKRVIGKAKPVIAASGSKVKPSDRKVSMSKKRKKEYRTPVFILLLLLIGILFGWGINNQNSVKDYYSTYAKRIPMFYNNPGNYITNNVEMLPVKEMSESASGLWLIHLLKDDEVKAASLADDDLTFKDEKTEVSSESNEDIALDAKEPLINKAEDAVENGEGAAGASMDKENHEVKTADAKEGAVSKAESDAVEKTTDPISKVSDAKPDETYRYYIIAGSFSSESNALHLVKQLRQKGYRAVVAGTSQTGMIRVAYMGFNRFKQALQQLSVIRQQENASAWIMKK